MLLSSSWRTVVLQLLLLSVPSIDASTTVATASTASTTVAISPSSDSSNASSIVPSSSSTTTAPPSAESSFINSTATCHQDTLRRDEATPSPAVPTESASPPGASEETQLSTEGSSVLSASPTIIVPPPPPPPPPLKIPDDPPQPSEQPLDTAVFLSFEEWKNQNLAKVGQSSDSFTQREQRGGQAPVQGAHHASLDGLGDEIEIDFGFGSAGSPANTIQVSGSQATGTAKPSTPMPRSKDAGKTCKERFNYASLDCAATVHRHNKEIKGAHSILMENKESYMLNKCEAKEKFFIVELCEDILVDTVVLANFEFFSSVFKEIRVSVSDTYPVKTNGWKELGTYVARNTRDVQAFLIENPLIWARYLKVEILSHYGNEYYCPISLLRVHGTTMMEEFRHESSQRGGEDDVREDIRPEAVAEPVKSAEAEEEAQQQQQQEDIRNSIEATPTAPIVVPEPENTLAITVVEDVTTTPSVTAETATRVTATTCYDPWESMNRRYIFPMELPTCPRYISISPTPTKASTAFVQPASQQVPGPIGMYPTETASTATGSAASSATASSVSSALIPKEPPVIRPVAPQIQEPVKPSYISPPIAAPTTQESFFKSVHKRLTGLESNSTLTLQYIEEQSRLMRDTFTKMEKAHVAKMEKLLENVNASAFSDLAAYREKYDQLWQSTVLALESHRLLSEREMLAISTRLTFLADEVIFQKRMYQLNTVLLVITIGVVIFSRNDRLAMPLGRHLRTHSNISNIRIFESPPQSPMLQVRKKRSDSDDSSVAGGSIPGSVVGSPGGSNTPGMMSPPASREGSPAVEEMGLSPGSLPPSQGSQLVAGSGNKHTEKGNERRKSWVYGFGPKLKPEGRGRMFKRQPSPLVQGEPGPAIYEGEEVGGT